jgi:hypothetical protein
MALKQLENLVLRVGSVIRGGRYGLERVSNPAKATPVSSPRHPRALLVMPTDQRGADNQRPLRAGRLASFATGAASGGLAIFAGRTILSGWSRHGTFPRSANASFTTRTSGRKREHVRRFGYPSGRGQQWPAAARPERRTPAASLCGQ